jgi:hypothetical protein
MTRLFNNQMKMGQWFSIINLRKKKSTKISLAQEEEKNRGALVCK